MQLRKITCAYGLIGITLIGLMGSMRHSYGQTETKIILNSKVVDANEKGIDRAHILNSRTQELAVSAPDGSFSIGCLIGDTLVFSALGYSIQRIVITSYFTEGFLLHKTAYEIKEIEISSQSNWSKFQNDFRNLDVPRGPQVNRIGLPNGPISKVPIPLRSDLFVSKPKVTQMIMSPFSTLAYYTSKIEREKRKVLKKMKVDASESFYWSYMQTEKISELVNNPDTILINDFILFCNEEIEDKTIDGDYYLREQIFLLYQKFMVLRRKND